MKLSISNIAWSKEYDEEMYKYILDNGFCGLEIAPTRLIEKSPYSNVKEAKRIVKNIYDMYKLEISSMQSIWFGKQEEIFNSESERNTLIEYTKKAIDFASEINCKNLVFGCPKNRNINNLENYYKIALDFFEKIGEYAKNKGVIFAIEPNPTIYNTNFINTTEEAIKLVKDINNEGIKINLDLGTIIQNNEDISILKDNINLINHIHISEPNLEYIKERNIHVDLIKLLKDLDYDKYISIEMKNQNNVDKVKKIMNYVKVLVMEENNGI